MNIPDNILQTVADAAFAQSSSSPLSCVTNGTNWKRQPNIRRAVIQHALSNPALAPFLAGNAIASAEKAEAELAKSREINQGLTNSCLGWEKIVQELKSSQLGILRPIAEMPETVPDGCVMVFGSSDSNGVWDISDILSSEVDTDFAILRLPSAEAPPPAEPEPAAQVPLGPEDCPPGSVLKALSWEEYEWRSVSHVYSEGVLLDNCPTTHYWIELKANWQINTSIPDTGRWDKDAWRDCSKPGKEVAK